jgi:putative aldouronate transport system permease protein
MLADNPRTPSNKIRDGKGDRFFDIINLALLALVFLVVAYPLYFTIVASISNPYANIQGKTLLYPVGLTLEAYKNVLENDQVWIGYRNTILYTVSGTLLNLILTIPLAYVLSKQILPLRKLLTWVFLFTMYFSGGMIPTYLIVKGLHLVNTPLVMVILGGLSVYNMILTRTYYENSIPGELYEAAYVDGASEIRTFFRIALPLSGPIVAVMVLFYAVARWNDFFNALLYVSDRRYYPLQLVLRNILILNQQMGMSSLDALSDIELELAMRRQLMAESMKYSLIFIASFPVILAYSFVQKYFVKGVMIGAVKG